MKLLDLLVLDRPLIVFDCETTGPNPQQDRICELGLTHIKLDRTIKEWRSYVNPQMPIPHEATFGNPDRGYAGHGITDDMVKDAPTFAQLAPNLLIGFKDCDYAGYNVKRYDLPLIQTEFSRNGHQWSYANARVIDGFRLWQLGEARTLSDAVLRFLRRKHEGAHGALSDVQASADVLAEQLEIYTQLPRTVQALHDLQWPVDPNALDPDNKIVWRNGVATMNFGKKWRDKPLHMMTRRDLLWIANDAKEMSDVVRQICADAAAGKFPTPPPAKEIE